MVEIDSTQMGSIGKREYDIVKWKCSNFSRQFAINFAGYEYKIPDEYEKRYNGRFNLPLYHAVIYKHNSELDDAAVNMILVGDDPLNLSDWLIMDPVTCKEMSLDYFQPDYDIGIFTIDYLYSHWAYKRTQVIKFHFDENRNVKVVEYHPDLVLNNITSIDEIIIPSEYYLKNYPNPFNVTTTIEYYIPKISDVKLNIYNLLGQEVKTLVDESKAEGIYREKWDGTNDFEQKVSSGIYIYRLKADDFITTRKMILLK